MQCPNCERVWPGEFKVYPLCTVPLSRSTTQDKAATISGCENTKAAGRPGCPGRGGEGVGRADPRDSLEEQL
jgi:hypothetical protein